MEIKGLGMIATVARDLIGFLLACLVVGFVTVLFVYPPAELAALPANVFSQRASQAGTLALLAATHSALFGAAFAFIAAVIGEWLSIRSFVYYLFAGTVIGLLGFLTQYSSEIGGQPTILNNYALKAFLTAGFFGGLVYWLAAGQFAGSDEGAAAGPEADKGPGLFGKGWVRPKIIVADSPDTGKIPASLSERIEKPEPKIQEKPPATAKPAMASATTSVPSTKPAADQRPKSEGSNDKPQDGDKSGKA